MKMLIKEYTIVRGCTHGNCNNYRSGSLLNSEPKVMDIRDLFGDPEPCSKCGMGCMTVKRASFVRDKGQPYKAITREFRFLVKCMKCNIAWTATRVAPLNLADIGVLEFLKSASVDELKCRGCKSNKHMVLLQATEL